LPAGVTYRQPVSSLDIFATAAAAAGSAPPADVEGVNLIPFLDGTRATAPHTRFYWRQGARTALRQGDWKLVNMQRGPQAPSWELYDLSTDLSEQHDLAADYPEVVERLETRWRALDAEMVPARFR